MILFRKGTLRWGVLWPPADRYCCQGRHRFECWHSGQDIHEQWACCEIVFPLMTWILIIQSTVTATYVPAHLHHILFEVFKNSMRATCETAEKRQIHELPHIRSVAHAISADLLILIFSVAGYSRRKMTSRSRSLTEEGGWVGVWGGRSSTTCTAQLPR